MRRSFTPSHATIAIIAIATVSVTATPGAVASPDPTCAAWVGALDLRHPTYLDTIAVTGDTVVTHDTYGLTAWPLADPVTPELGGSWYRYPAGFWPPTRGKILPTAVPGTVVSLFADGVAELFAVGDPDRPRPTTRLGEGIAGAAVAPNGTTVALLSEAGDLSLFEIRSADRIERRCDDCVPALQSISFHDIAFTEERHLAVLSFTDLILVDLAAPGGPTITGTVRALPPLRHARLWVGHGSVLVEQRDEERTRALDLYSIVNGSPSLEAALLDNSYLDLAYAEVGAATALLLRGDRVSTTVLGEIVELDLADPVLPPRGSGSPLPGSPTGAARLGDRLYVATSDHGVLVANREAGGTWTTVHDAGAVGEVWDFDAAGERGVLTYWRRGEVLVLDLTEPVRPRLGGSTMVGDHALAVGLDPPLAYVTAAPHALVTVDVSSPASPTVAWQDPAGEADQFVAVVAGDLLATTGGRRLPSGDWVRVVELYDLTDPVRPALSGRWGEDQGADPTGLAFGDGALYAANEGFIEVFDFADGAGLRHVATLDLSSHSQYEGRMRLARAGSVLAVAGGSATWLVDLSQPLAPQEVTRLGYQLRGMVTVGETMAGFNETHAIDLLDISDPASVPNVTRLYRQSRSLDLFGAGDGVLYGVDNAFIDVYTFDCLPPEAEFRIWSHGTEVWLEDRSQRVDLGSLAISWDLGDGSTSSAAGVYHRYPGPGVYRIALTVTNPFGSDTAEATVALRAGTAAVSEALRRPLGRVAP